MRLSLKKEIKGPIDGKNISPDSFVGKSNAEIGKLSLWEGNRQRILDQFFEVDGECEKESEVSIKLVGNMSKVRGIGTAMTMGRIEVKGNAGMFTGQEMEGGRIIIRGSAGSWTGSAMKGGIIDIAKNAGDYIGAPYRGETKGMKAGTIIIRGNAGTEVGGYMRKGQIEILGNVGQFAGIRMKGGIIVVRGDAEERAGAFMTNGKIVLCGHIRSILPTFTIDRLKRKTKTETEEIEGPFYVFTGDLAENGRGNLFVSKDRNSYLEKYERFL